MKEWLARKMQAETIVWCHELEGFGHGYRHCAYDVAQTMLRQAGWDYYIGIDAWCSSPAECHRYSSMWAEEAAA